MQDLFYLSRSFHHDQTFNMAGMIRLKVQQKADLALVLVAAFWGSTSLLTKIGLEDMEGFNLIALRFIIAFILMAPLFWKRLKAISLTVAKHAALLGAILFLNYVLFTFGVKHTSISNAGFLTCLAGVMVPVIGVLFLKMKPDLKTVFCILLVFTGVYLLTFNGELQFNRGDFLSVLCSLSFAIHIITTGHFSRLTDDPILLALLQLGFVALYASFFSFIFEKPQLPQTARSWMVVLALSIFSTALGLILQTAAQRYTTPTHAGLILTLEPVFAALFAFFFAREILVPKAYLGALIMLIGIVLVEIDFKGSRRTVKQQHPSS